MSFYATLLLNITDVLVPCYMRVGVNTQLFVMVWLVWFLGNKHLTVLSVQCVCRIRRNLLVMALLLEWPRKTIVADTLRQNSHAINCNTMTERSTKTLITTEFIFPGIGAVLA